MANIFSRLFGSEIGENGDSFLEAMELVSSTALPVALQSAFELGVFEAIAKAGDDAKLSAKEIADKISSKNPEAPTMLDRVLRLLASHSVLHCSVLDYPQGKRRFYSLSPVSKYFVTNGDSVSSGPLLALIPDKVFLDSWSQLTGAVMEGGRPFNRVYGIDASEDPSSDPRFNEVFNKAMYNFKILIMNKILEFYEGFESINKILVVVEVGLGDNLNLITSKYPHVQGIKFDLPRVIGHAPDYPGVEHEGGDMFESVPEVDAIFIEWILRDLSDERCLKLLKNCYNAIPNDGKVIVVEFIRPIEPETHTAAKTAFQLDVLLIMTQNLGGKERTREEFVELATSAGFSGIRLVGQVSGIWVMEFVK